ncbi:MAG TPA: AzlC family ABC transporter permease [Candidatus Limnocylindrales bacterium]|nr:AzlC family ABC transporter permease [Candidatus Limnocylindrales bacterium]
MDEPVELRSTLLSAAPLALAIGVFGVIFGAAASVALDPLMTIGMSALVFSGSLQFALLGLVTSGAGPIALIATAVALNARHIVLGAVLRPRFKGTFLVRALQSAVILDESFGLAVASGSRAPTVLVTSGVLFYVAWIGGTMLGVLGASVAGLESLASAIFPVLFIGLAAVTGRGRDAAVRAAIAAVAVIVLSILVPSAYTFMPIVAAIVVALPGGRAR